MSDIDLAWAAGFFDAEGCFSASSRPPVATMSQATLECLDIFDAILDGAGTLRGPYEKSTASMKRKPQWIYTAYGRDARQIFDALRSWLGSYRIEQARACFESLPLAAPTSFESHPWGEQVAWAGGFFDGEGCFAWINVTMTARITIPTSNWSNDSERPLASERSTARTARTRRASEGSRSTCTQ